MNKFEKAMICGLFLSKFNENGYRKLGFENWTEFYNTVGLLIDVKATSIKNYRDEFDPFFENNRIGYNKRPMHKSRISIFENYKNLEFNEFCNLLITIIENKDPDLINLDIKNETSQFAKRLITGKAAENYFRENYKNIDLFNDGELIDSTQFGCGFDFKIEKQNYFYGVEVKGLYQNKGKILLTEKEVKIAELLKENYFLFVVKNFIEIPNYKLFRNPLFNNDITFVKTEQDINQTYYYAQI